MPGYPLDVAGPGLYAITDLGVPGVLVWFVVVVALETAILAATRWASPRRSLRDAFFMNLVTVVVGVLALAVLRRAGIGTWFVFSLVASVLIEWGVLALLDRGRTRPAFFRSLAANLASYVLTGLVLVGLGAF